MHLRLIAVGDRQPAWVDAAYEQYAGRLPGNWQFGLTELPAARRTTKSHGDAARDEEGGRILKALLVLLDERGRQLTTREFATKLDGWQQGGRDVAFVIGGADGAADAVKKAAGFTWSLSSLTLPHGLARVCLVEQLYRGWSLASGHPYHRD